MQRTRDLFHALGAVIWTGAFAVLFTALVSGTWAGLLIANLKTSPGLPWSVAAMFDVLVGMVTFLNGNWGHRRSRGARRALLRLRPVRPGVFAWAVIAGTLAVTALSGFWIVLFQLTTMAGNASDFSRLPPLTVVSALAMAAVSGAVSEEAAFRGYLQSTLERCLPAWCAIIVVALMMMPEHASTQGFGWPTVVFYLLVDVMLGVTAYLTQSILPGIVIHTIGLVTFFGFIWPYDKLRQSVWVHGADVWFVVHAGQAAVFGLLAVLAYLKLARLIRGRAPRGSRSSPAGLSAALKPSSLTV